MAEFPAGNASNVFSAFDVEISLFFDCFYFEDAAGHLQRVKMIQCQRGHITVLDRAELERRSCDCYAAVKKECRRLLPTTTAT